MNDELELTGAPQISPETPPTSPPRESKKVRKERAMRKEAEATRYEPKFYIHPSGPEVRLGMENVALQRDRTAESGWKIKQKCADCGEVIDIQQGESLRCRTRGCWCLWKT